MNYFAFKYRLLLVGLLLLPLNLYAQQLVTLSGIIYDEHGNPLSGASIAMEGTPYSVTSDDKGAYSLKTARTSYNLLITKSGYLPNSIEINLLPDEAKTVDVVLLEKSSAVEEVWVVGKSNAQILREEAYAVEAIEMEDYKNAAVNLNDILSSVSGLNIRQSGGLGSDFVLALNGLSGNQVRTFLDGVPMDYFGSSLSLFNFSPNLIEEIEVYKGVTPIHLASDALGGAINVVTDQDAGSFLDVSYLTGSFGTRIGTLNGQYRNENTGFTTKLMSFYNYSKNDYEVPIRLISFDEFGIGTRDDFYTNVKHFHDTYKSKMIWLQSGYTGTDFADNLLFGVMHSDNYDEVQQAPFATAPPAIPYGEVVENERKRILNFSYKKNRLFDDRLSLDAYVVAVDAKNSNTDVSDYQYDWFGNATLRNNTVGGEIESRKTQLVLDVENNLGRINAEYEIDDKNNVAINYSINDLEVQGTDSYKQQNATQFQFPSEVKKDVAAVAYTNASFDQMFKNTIFAKYYNYQINSLETDYSGDDIIPFETKKNYTGYGFTSIIIFDEIRIKGSYENAFRFPEFVELFGDGLNIVPNPALSPEESDNYNLGFIYMPSALEDAFQLSLNTFLRESENFIHAIAIGLKSRHENHQSVTSRGLDLTTKYNPTENWSLSLSGSYIDKRDNDVIINGEKARFPNEPYFFGNFSVTYLMLGLLDIDDTFSASFTQNYVHEFSYSWEQVGEDKPRVPQQSTSDLGFVYSHSGGSLNYSLGVVNVFDADVYDNYQQLQPGRAFYLKFRYFID